MILTKELPSSRCCCKGKAHTILQDKLSKTSWLYTIYFLNANWEGLYWYERTFLKTVPLGEKSQELRDRHMWQPWEVILNKSTSTSVSPSPRDGGPPHKVVVRVKRKKHMQELWKLKDLYAQMMDVVIIPKFEIAHINIYSELSHAFES